MDLRGLADLSGQHAVGHEEHIAVEAHAVVASAHLRHDAVDPHQLAVGQHPIEGHDVVELEVRALAHAHPELERGGVFGADHPADNGAFNHRNDGKTGV